MANRRTTFNKLQRERAKKAKAAAKRDRRLERADELATAPDEAPTGSEEGELSAAELLDRIEHVHKQLAAKEIDHEEFEEKKLELLSRLPID